MQAASFAYHLPVTEFSVPMHTSPLTLGRPRSRSQLPAVVKQRTRVWELAETNLTRGGPTVLHASADQVYKEGFPLASWHRRRPDVQLSRDVAQHRDSNATIGSRRCSTYLQSSAVQEAKFQVGLLARRLVSCAFVTDIYPLGIMWKDSQKDRSSPKYA